MINPEKLSQPDCKILQKFVVIIGMPRISILFVWICTYSCFSRHGGYHTLLGVESLHSCDIELRSATILKSTIIIIRSEIPQSSNATSLCSFNMRKNPMLRFSELELVGLRAIGDLGYLLILSTIIGHPRPKS